MEFLIIFDADAFCLKIHCLYEKLVGMYFLTLKPLITARSEFSVDAA